MIDHLLRFTVPAGYALLPPTMHSPAATALVLAIGLQESQCLERHQVGGTARGFWQFDRPSVEEVLTHRATAAPIAAALRTLRFPVTTVRACHPLIEHNDTVAFLFARLLLWTYPGALPPQTDPAEGWRQYLDRWKPGKPHPATWDTSFAEAWDRVERADIRASIQRDELE